MDIQCRKNYTADQFCNKGFRTFCESQPSVIWDWVAILGWVFLCSTPSTKRLLLLQVTSLCGWLEKEMAADHSNFKEGLQWGSKIDRSDLLSRCRWSLWSASWCSHYRHLDNVYPGCSQSSPSPKVATQHTDSWRTLSEELPQEDNGQQIARRGMTFSLFPSSPCD